MFHIHNLSPPFLIYFPLSRTARLRLTHSGLSEVAEGNLSERGFKRQHPERTA